MRELQGISTKIDATLRMAELSLEVVMVGIEELIAELGEAVDEARTAYNRSWDEASESDEYDEHLAKVQHDAAQRAGLLIETRKSVLKISKTIRTGKRSLGDLRKEWKSSSGY